MAKFFLFTVSYLRRKIEMKAFAYITAICILVVSLFGCTPNADSIPKDISSANVETTTEDIIAALPENEKSWMNVTPAQYLEDFDFLYSEMKDNYPYFNVVSRKIGVDIDKAYADYRKKVEICTTDVDFVAAVREYVEQMKYVGHLSSWGYRYNSELENMKEFIEQFPKNKKQLTPYISKLDNPTSKRNYQAMQEFYEKIDLQLEKTNQSVSSSAMTDDNFVENPPNVETKILQDGEIAYVKINGFDMNSYKSDKKILLPFYDSVLNYDHIIIDITDNFGGGMDYFNDLVVAPLISKILSVSTYMLIKGGENNKHFLQVTSGIVADIWKPIEDLPMLPKLAADDRKDMDYFSQADYTIEPLNEQKGFKGKIWLLVSSNNYSSSEYAAMFSKHSGFATLVGEQTGGDGIGVDPAYFILPNSGLVVQYSPVYGITPDGASSEEFGTTPDIVSEKNESPLDTCLKAIDLEK